MENQLIQESIKAIREKFTSEEIQSFFSGNISGLANVDQAMAMQILSIIYLSQILQYKDYINNQLGHIISSYTTIKEGDALSSEGVVNALQNLTHYYTQFYTSITKIISDLVASEDTKLTLINSITANVFRMLSDSSLKDDSPTGSVISKSLLKTSAVSITNSNIKKNVHDLKEKNKNKEAEIFELISKKTLNITINSLESNLVKAITKEVKLSLKQGAYYAFREHKSVAIASSTAILLLGIGYTLTSDQALDFAKTQLNKLNLEKAVVTAVIAAATHSGYRYGWKLSNGDIALKNFDLIQTMSAYYAAYGLHSFAKEHIPQALSFIVKLTKNYVENSLGTQQQKSIIKVSEILRKLDNEIKKNVEQDLPISNLAEVKTKIEQNSSRDSLEGINSLNNSSYLEVLKNNSVMQQIDASHKMEQISYDSSKDYSKIGTNDDNSYVINNITFAASTLIVIAAVLKLCGFKKSLLNFDNPINVNLQKPSIDHSENYKFNYLTELLNSDPKAMLVAKMVKSDQEKTANKKWNQQDVEKFVNSPKFQETIEEVKRIQANLRTATEKDFGIERRNKNTTKLKRQRNF